MFEGFLFGYFLVGFLVVLVDGVFYLVDSFVVVFEWVVSEVFCLVVVDGLLVVFEFVMFVDVMMLEDYVGVIIGDLNSWCGLIVLIELIFLGYWIEVYVLFVEMFGYVGVF